MGFMKTSAPLLAASLVCVAGSVASADISDIIFQVRAENSLGSALFEHRFDLQYWNEERQEYEWNLLSPVMMLDAQGNEIAQLLGGRAYCLGDPQVSVNFAVNAGGLNTAFTITSALLSFGTIGVASGRASGGIGATDNLGDGVILSQMGADAIYTSQYNGFVPGGTVFVDLFGTGLADATPGGSPSASADFPGGGMYAPIGGPLFDISSRFRFGLTPFDTAIGTSVFEVIPGPGALSLLGLGGLLAARRRSR